MHDGLQVWQRRAQAPQQRIERIQAAGRRRHCGGRVGAGLSKEQSALVHLAGGSNQYWGAELELFRAGSRTRDEDVRGKGAGGVREGAAAALVQHRLLQSALLGGGRWHVGAV